MTRKSFIFIYLTIAVIIVTLWGLHIISTNTVTFFILCLAIFSSVANIYFARKRNDQSKK